MKINSTGAASHINMGVASRAAVGFAGTSDHDNGVRAHGNPDSFRSDFRGLVRAVKSGDMTAAQSALAAIKTDVASHAATYSPASEPASAESPLSADLKALFDAVGSGDTTGAKSALVQFASDRRSAWQAPVAPGSTASVSDEAVHGHRGRRFYDLEAVIASLFSDSSGATSNTDTSSTAPVDSTPTDSTTTDPSSTESTSTDPLESETIPIETTADNTPSESTEAPTTSA